MRGGDNRQNQSVAKLSQIGEFVYKLIQNIDQSCLLSRELSHIAKCTVREKTTPMQFMNKKVRETSSDLR